MDEARQCKAEEVELGTVGYQYWFSCDWNDEPHAYVIQVVCVKVSRRTENGRVERKSWLDIDCVDEWIEGKTLCRHVPLGDEEEVAYLRRYDAALAMRKDWDRRSKGVVEQIDKEMNT